MKKLCLISLGCAKNLVDSEIILGMLEGIDIFITNKKEEADVFLLNTCAFLEESRIETLKIIDELKQFNKPLVVLGCYSERYKDKLENLDNIYFVPISRYAEFHLLLSKILKTNVNSFNPLRRKYATLPFSAYLRISEGCNNFCSFCAIPLIRGRFKSRPLKEILEEAKLLNELGKKEITIISQDTTNYGRDLQKRPKLITLLEELVKFEGFESIRLLYLYPSDLSDELITFIKRNPKMVPYFDLPFQHASNRILRLMNRRGKKEDYIKLINRIRLEIPHAILRATFIVGFPGETREDIEELAAFIKEIEFNHIGVFTYSKEEGTRSYAMESHINEEEKNKRKDYLMNLQKSISLKKNMALIGQKMSGYIIYYEKNKGRYLMRTYFNAPDEIDGNIYLYSNNKFEIGDKLDIEITSAFIYDLIARPL